MRNETAKESKMDGKRRINPQNPARKIRGRKQKKNVLLNSDAVAQSPSTPAAVPDSGAK